MTSRRACLEQIRASASTHAGVWLDKFLPAQTQGGTKGQHIQQGLDNIRVPMGYEEAFRRRKTAFQQAPRPMGMVLRCAQAVAQGRVVVGLGQKSVLEVGLTLEHTWGLPYLPGSSLKGIAAWAARDSQDPAWHEGGDSYLALFGDTDESGAVRFLDAWWEPKGSGLPVHLDTMTVHHPHYYQSDDETPPSDMDSPTPVAFASASGAYEVMLEGPEAWVEAAGELLKRGLRDHGIGAKTAGGYGRLDLDWVSMEEERRRKEKEVERRREKVRRSVSHVGRHNAGVEVRRILADLDKAADSSIAAEARAQLRSKLTVPWLQGKVTGPDHWAAPLLADLPPVSRPREKDGSKGVGPATPETAVSRFRERIDAARAHKVQLRSLVAEAVDSVDLDVEDLMALRKAFKAHLKKRAKPADRALAENLAAKIEAARAAP